MSNETSNVISFEEKKKLFNKKNEQKEAANQQRVLAGTAKVKNLVVSNILDTLRSNGIDTRNMKGLLEITSLIDLSIDATQGIENNFENILAQIKHIINPPIDIA